MAIDNDADEKKNSAYSLSVHRQIEPMDARHETARWRRKSNRWVSNRFVNAQMPAHNDRKTMPSTAGPSTADPLKS